MQTSKSYAQTSNLQIKLELDDLEYVFADGQNLLIKPNVTEESVEEGNILYADGSQAVVLQSGVKHFIQTIGGETYLVQNDNDNMQQIIINAEDQSEESNDSVEYIQDEDNVGTVIYKFAEPENEIEEVEPETKRFKIGDVEYITVSEGDSVQFNNNQYNILQEDGLPENEGFQYAILKDGKLHLQVCDTDAVQIFSDNSEDRLEILEENGQADKTENQLDDENYEIAEEKIQEYVLVNSDLTEISENLPENAGKNLITGKAVTLDEYFNGRPQYEVNEITKTDTDNNAKSVPSEDGSEFLNKKVLIRKNANGKSLFGKILHIEPAKKNQPAEKPTDIEDTESNETIALKLATDEPNANQTEDDKEDKAIAVPKVCNNSEEETSATYPSEINSKDVTEEQMSFLSKTLNGLADMPSLREKLMEHRLEISYVEKHYDAEAKKYIKDVRYVSGRLMQQDNEWIVDDTNEEMNVTSITVAVTKDKNNEKVTKVIFHEKATSHEKQITCQACSRSFTSVALLNKHMQIYHTARSLSCNICYAKFNNHVLLTEHRKANGHYFVCETCNKRFTTQSSLKRHLNTHDQNLKQLKCVICKEGFSSVASLSKHLLTDVHNKAHQCESCGKTFATVADMNAHKRTHNPVKMCYCEICGREFSRHSNLLRHAEIHKGDGDLYKCGICECSYKFISSLTRHIVQNHMKQEET